MSRPEAQIHFETTILPRRKKLNLGQHSYQASYRRVLPDEKDRGEPFPPFIGSEGLSLFGIGIGIYFMQLLVFGVVFLIGGLILFPAVMAYRSPNYGVISKSAFVTISAACHRGVNVTASSGCADSTPCRASYRPNCVLPESAPKVDVAMCLFVVVAVIASRYLEGKIEEELDEEVQTASDYSMAVLDPPVDATGPDEWMTFFSRFGTVRCVTVTRKNSQVIGKMAEKYKILQMLMHEVKETPSCWDRLFSPSREELEAKLGKVQKELNDLLQLPYEANRVYISFEREEAQRLALQELEVADVVALTNSVDLSTSSPRVLFRGSNALNVEEPCEPGIIRWSNTETGATERTVRWVGSHAIVLALLACAYYYIRAITPISTTLLSVGIGVLDALLPLLFRSLTEVEITDDEGVFQSSLQQKLFFARVLLSTMFPYVAVAWDAFIDESYIYQIVSIQIAACFTGPLVSALDGPGIVKRHIISRIYPFPWPVMKALWSGNEWDLAERYTGLGKIAFVSMFYAMLTPVAMLIACAAFLLVFITDMFQLTRRWCEKPLLNRAVAGQLRKQLLLAVAAHMYVTSRFIYSWPMDSAHLLGSSTSTTTSTTSTTASSPSVSPSPGPAIITSEWSLYTFARVDKTPPYRLWHMQVQEWMQPSQRHNLRLYVMATLVVCSAALYYWLVQDLIEWLRRFLVKETSKFVVSDLSGVGLSEVGRLPLYCPLTGFNGDLHPTADIEQLPAPFHPSVKRHSHQLEQAFVEMIPRAKWSEVLATIKW